MAIEFKRLKKIKFGKNISTGNKEEYDYNETNHKKNRPIYDKRNRDPGLEKYRIWLWMCMALTVNG